MSDNNLDTASQTDLDAALSAAKPSPKISSRDIAADVERIDADSADTGLQTSDQSVARDETLAPGHLYDADPNPGNPVGTRGMESTREDTPQSGRGIAGAYSGDPEKLRDEDRNNNPSKA